jgi:hypothetical protein
MTSKRIDKCCVSLVALAAGLLLGSAALAPASALERGGINTGGTSFFDGFAGLAPGCTYIQYLTHDTFTQANDANGNKIPLGVTLDINAAAPQIACNSDLKLFDGVLGWNTIIPFANQDAGGVLTSNGTGLGDVMVGPYIQFPPVMSGGHPVFSHGFEFDIFTPTGKFSASQNVNPGNDYWSISPFWKATWLPAQGWEVSWRLSYIHNFDHIHSVNASQYAAPDGTIQHAGDGGWVNFTVSREFVKDFYFGLNGYWLKQFAADTLPGGAAAPLGQQESLYMGPGFHYTLDPKNIVNFNVYLPVYNVNALSGGYQLNLQYIHPLN